MKKKLIITASVILSLIILIMSALSASAAVYAQDGKFKYQLFGDNTAAWAGYTGETVDDVTVPRYYDNSKIISVANFALENNSKIRSVDFMEAPDLSKIGMYAFSGCSSLESILIPDSISFVDISAFRGCTALTDVVFYGNNNSVPVECFYNCTSLKNVRLSAFLKSIQSHAFAGCTSLEYLELLDTVQYIAPNAFKDDHNLTLGVYYGSYAHQYAMDNNIAYVLLDGVKLGDADGDGAVTIYDVTSIQQHVADMKYLEGIYLYAADVNRDGVTNISDATDLQRFLAEYEVEYPIDSVITQ